MSKLWDVALEVQLALGANYRSANESINQETGLEQLVWNQLITALSYEPEAISTAQLRKRNPYSAPSVSDQRLESLRARGWLEAQPSSEFRLTESGRAQGISILRTLRAYHATMQPLPASEMNRIEELLGRMVTAADGAATPPGTWCLTRARRLTPPDGAAPTTKVDYYLSCLNAFRDDSHLAAWQAQEVGGEDWELFTSIWRSERRTLEELSTELAFRGQAREVYQAALERLTARGWVAQTDEAYSLTAAGRALREQVESTTDQFFTEAEAALTEPEAQELGALMAKLLVALNE